MADAIVLGILGIVIFLVLRYKWKVGKNQEGCCGCGCSQGKCKDCSQIMEKCKQREITIFEYKKEMDESLDKES